MARRWITYKGRKILIEDKENKLQAQARVDAQIAKEEADRREREIAERAEQIKKLNEQEERKKTPKYADGTMVLGKDGKYYKVYEGYYQEDDKTVYYTAEPVTPTGKLNMPDDPEDDRWSMFPSEIDQKDIQKKVKAPTTNKALQQTEARTLHRQALEGLDAEWGDFGRDEMDGIPTSQYISDDLQSAGKFSEKETEQIMTGKADYALTCRFLAFMARREMTSAEVKSGSPQTVAHALSWAVDSKISDNMLKDIMKYIK